MHIFSEVETSVSRKFNVGLKSPLPCNLCLYNRQGYYYEQKYY